MIQRKQLTFIDELTVETEEFKDSDKHVEKLIEIFLSHKLSLENCLVVIQRIYYWINTKYLLGK